LALFDLRGGSLSEILPNPLNDTLVGIRMHDKIWHCAGEGQSDVLDCPAC
jgi:hypothetical protein